MQGKVALVNERRGMVAAYTDKGDFTVFHVEGDWAVSLHDVISGELDGSGDVMLTNETAGCQLQASIRDTHDSLLSARRHLGV